MPIISQKASTSGGGYTPPITREQLGSASTSVAYQTTTPLSWASKQSGDTLIALTDPTNPTIITTGVYAITCQVAAAGAMTAGTNFTAQLDVDFNGEDSSLGSTSAAATALQTRPRVLLATTYYCVAGAVLQVSVVSQDVAAPAFQVLSTIQRIS